MKKRFSIIDVQKEVAALKKATGAKNINSFLRECQSDVDITCMLESEDLDDQSTLTATKLKDLCIKYGVVNKKNSGMTDDEFINKLIDMLFQICNKSIFLTDEFVRLEGMTEELTTDTTPFDLLMGIKGFKTFELNLYDYAGLSTYPMRVTICNLPFAEFIQVMFDFYEDEEKCQHFPSLFIEKRNGMCYFEHYSENDKYRDSYTIQPYARAKDKVTCYRLKFNAIAKRYFEDSDGFISSHFIDCHIQQLLVCIRAFYRIKDAEVVEIKVRKEADLEGPKVKKQLKKFDGIEIVEPMVDNLLVDNRIPLKDIVVKRVYERKPWQGGHHASPRPHDRCGYWRRKSKNNPERIWVEATRVHSPKYKENTPIVMDAIQV